MQVTVTNPETPFVPFTISIEVETRDELRAIKAVAGADQRIPHLLRDDLQLEGRRALDVFLMLLHSAVPHR